MRRVISKHTAGYKRSRCAYVIDGEDTGNGAFFTYGKGEIGRNDKTEEMMKRFWKGKVYLE